jgi:2-dehydro-3-deoxyphosphooctonate aldolase (KDO 8-P synthase)
MMKRVPVKDFFIGEREPLTICAGPCVIESEEHCFRCAETLKSMFAAHSINFVFKSSYDKANRTSGQSFRGLGMTEGLRILKRVKEELNLPVVTDVHSPQEAQAAAEVCDIIQIPAFLCRQTDLLLAAGRTGAVIQVKKGQFLAPWDMEYVVKKILSTGNEKVILVDRGTCFGYNSLVSDMRAIPMMQTFGFPVCFDATHSVQLPGKGDGVTGGERQYVPILARAALAAGANALFLETHPNPAEAKSDAATMLPFSEFADLLKQLEQLYRLMKTF